MKLTFKQLSIIATTVIVFAIIAVIYAINIDTTEPIEIVEEVYIEEIVPAPTFYEIDSIYSIGAIDETYFKAGLEHKDIKYILYKDALATDIYSYHSNLKTMEYTITDLKEYLMYMYVEANPTPFQF